MTPVAIRSIPRAAPEHVGALSRFGVSTIHEAMGRSGLMKPYLRPIYAGAAACGPAVTVLAQPGDNWMLHVAVEMCRPGDMLVVAVTTDNTDGMFGELLATSLKARGVVGLVIDAGCRDVTALTEMGFPVWPRAVNPRGTVKATPGCVNVPIICAGALVTPGDVVVADDDGVVVVPRAEAEAVARASALREAKEDATRKRLAAGELGLDIYGMREALSKAGLTWLDEAP